MHLPRSVRDKVSHAIYSNTCTQTLFNETTEVLIQDMREMAHEFIRISIQKYLVNLNKIKIIQSQQESNGLGECFCITDKNSKDNPIIMISDGFTKVTGYKSDDFIYHNCRFLQGRLTDKATVSRIEFAIINDIEICELLLNFKKDGTPFWNLVHIVPLYQLILCFLNCIFLPYHFLFHLLLNLSFDKINRLVLFL